MNTRHRGPIDPSVLRAPGSIPLWGALAALTLAETAALVVAARAFGGALSDAVVVHDLGGSAHEGLVLGAALVVRAVLRRLGSVTAHAAGERAAQAGGSAVLEAAASPQPDAARLAYLASEGLAKIATAIGSVAAPTLEAAVQIPVLVVLTWLASPILAIELVAGLVAMPVLAALIGLATDRRATAQLEATLRLERLYLDLVGGAATLAAFGRTDEQAQVVDRAARDLEERTMNVLSVAFLSGVSLDILSAIVVALVAVSIGIRLNDGSLALATGAAVLFWTPEVFAPLRAASLQFHTTADGRAAADAIGALTGPTQPREPAPTPVRWQLESAQGPRRERLVLEAFRPHELLLVPPLSLALGRGELCVVAGPSGIGKSTLLAAIAGRGAPPEGACLLDGTPLAPERVAWVPAASTFVPGTLGENLTLLSGPAGLETARALLVRLGASDLADRLDEPIAPGGANLSAGQRQRVALARALALGRSLLILDEPTSHLDAASEAAVIDLLAERARDGAVVIAASHRPRLIAAADVVVRLEPAVGAST